MSQVPRSTRTDLVIGLPLAFALMVIGVLLSVSLIDIVYRIPGERYLFNSPTLDTCGWYSSLAAVPGALLALGMRRQRGFCVAGIVLLLAALGYWWRVYSLLFYI